MNVCEQMPETIQEYIKRYTWVDTDHVISNGVAYVPVFRVENALRYYYPPKHAKDIYYKAKGHCEFKRSICGEEILEVWSNSQIKYCPFCGAEMEGTK